MGIDLNDVLRQAQTRLQRRRLQVNGHYVDDGNAIGQLRYHPLNKQTRCNVARQKNVHDLSLAGYTYRQRSCKRNFRMGAEAFRI